MLRIKYNTDAYCHARALGHVAAIIITRQGCIYSTFYFYNLAKLCARESTGDAAAGRDIPRFCEVGRSRRAHLERGTTLPDDALPLAGWLLTSLHSHNSDELGENKWG